MTNRSMLVAAVWMLSGCASVSTMGLARTLNKGAAQGWVAPSGGGVIALAASPGGTASDIGYPLIEGGGRFGITDHVELGAKIGFSGIGIEGKFAFIRPETMESGVNLSLNPGITFVGLGGGNLFVGTVTFHLPLLIGIDFNGHELVIGPRIIDQVLIGAAGPTGAAINLLYGGGSVGFAVKISPSFRMMPEVAVGVPFFATASAGGTTASTLGAGGLIFQAGLGFIFGSSDQYDRPAPPVLSAPPPSAPPGPPPVGPPPPPLPGP